MKRLHAYHRLVAAMLVAIFALATFAPLAEASNGRKKGRRYKGPVYETRVVERVVVPQRRYYQRRSSNAAPFLAGLIGGFILGATTTRAAQQERYVYWDPQCEHGFTSFDDARGHWSRHSGPRVLYKVESRSGRCVGAFRQDWDGWHEWDGNPAGWGDERYYGGSDGYDRTWDREHRHTGDCDH
jgi:hypothetical protein